MIVKLAVRAIGRPSGINAMATLTQSIISVGTLIQSGWSLRSQEVLNRELAGEIKGVSAGSSTKR